MLSDALGFLKRSDDWVATTIIGGVLSLLSILVLPMFVLQGYYVRAMRAAANGEDAAPSFTDWGGLFVDGIKLFVVTFVWSLVAIVPAVVLSAVVGLGTYALSGGAPGSGAAGSVGVGVLGLLGGLVVTLLALVVAYFVPAAGANFAIEGNFGAGFDVGTIVRGALTGEYAVAWVLAIVVAVVLGTIGSFLTVVLVGIFVIFYVQVTTYYLWARGFADGLGQRSGW